MEDNSEFVLKTLCCTCLSQDRHLYQLCRLRDGINILFMLLSHDTVAYREGFYKDAASLFVCWECTAILRKIIDFQGQVCLAQKKLSSIANGQIKDNVLKLSLSRLKLSYTVMAYDSKLVYQESDSEDNFVDCGITVDEIKYEIDDIPLSELQNHDHQEIYSDEKHVIENIKNSFQLETSNNIDKDIKLITLETKKKSKMKHKIYKKCLKQKLEEVENKEDSWQNNKKIKTKLKLDFYENHFTVKQLNEEEFKTFTEEIKSNVIYAKALYKCESCIEAFETDIDMQNHSSAFHTEKKNHLQCDICLVYIETDSLKDHRNQHFLLYPCKFCEKTFKNMTDIVAHIKNSHCMESKTHIRRKKVLKSGPSKHSIRGVRNKRTSLVFLCTECNKYFDNKNQRWKHVQRYHREGFKCSTCGKRFAFKNNLTRHEQVHQGPHPREECPICRKMIRNDLMKTHLKIHSARERFTCVECDKTFVSRASYDHHLKYTQAHVRETEGLLKKYKCSNCDKAYRSRGELKDHVNYQHLGKTRHKCPVCGKALATQRCITRHVRRAHHGIKENVRDKICQQCGKAFRDKKGLREHEFIHTGERPLSCEVCGSTFRQSASLYTHKKRIHKIQAQKKTVELLQENEQ